MSFATSPGGPLEDLRLPPPSVARELMRSCRLTPEDQDAMSSARPDPERDRDWWRVVADAAAELRSAMDRPLPAGGCAAWPVVARDAGPVGMWAYAWALLSVVPDLLELHLRRGIEADVTRDTLAGLGSVVAEHRQVTGTAGLGLFPLWGPPHAFAGIDYTIGRHTFTRCEFAVGDGPAGWVLQVHVPATGRLDEEASGESLSRAEQFFAAHFPEEPLLAMVCVSWVLDPQLGEYLRPDANLLRFQRRFQVLPRVPLQDAAEGDREMMRLGFGLEVPSSGGLSDADLARVPSTTSLHRAFVQHLRSGRHWHKRTGVRWLVQGAGTRRP